MPTVSRRHFTRLALGAAGAALVAPYSRAQAQVRFGSYPFQLGVASGDPSPDGFVIWTRLAPEPMDPARLGGFIYDVDWEVAEDRGFSRVKARGTAMARPHLVHAVHVEVTGLDPGREYFYRFRAGREESPIGRALTTPAPGTTPESLRLAFCSCAHYEQGFFSAYRYMADDRPDLVVELGDYIYEDAWGTRRVRLFDKIEAITLDDYRSRYAQYKTDPDLQAVHAACPWLVSWDDHEVDNDYAGLKGEHENCGTARAFFEARRAAAYQAWFEHMPVRPSRLLAGGEVRVYGTTDWGDLARIYLLDTRQYRSAQACTTSPTPERCDLRAGRKLLFGGGGGGEYRDPTEPACRAALQDPAQTMLGAEQERWLDGAIAGSRARWNAIAQGVMFTTVAEGTPESPRIWTDCWAGYPLARERILSSLAKHGTSNPVILTGDIHSFWLNEVRDRTGSTAALELVTSSIATSNSDKSAFVRQNPHVVYHEGQHSGYVRCEFTRDALRADFVRVEDIRDPRTAWAVDAAFEIRGGESRARRL
jgi:alkaline phosphatase D